MNQSAFKSFAVKEKKEVGTTARFLSGKMLIFAKLSLMSFIYDILETFCFPDGKVKKIYEKYQIEGVYIYHILTDRNSTSQKFVFTNNAASEIPNTKYREIIFEVICASRIGKRFDISHSFWSQFRYQNPELRKYLGYFEVVNIDNICQLTIASNPKEYFEMFEDRGTNKKDKGIKKGSSGIDFQNFPSRIVFITNLEHFQKPEVEYKEVARLTVDQK